MISLVGCSVGSKTIVLFWDQIQPQSEHHHFQVILFYDKVFVRPVLL
jgi:hypothetical protein